jgi:hypothetical protein
VTLPGAVDGLGEAEIVRLPDGHAVAVQQVAAEQQVPDGQQAVVCWQQTGVT